MAGMVHSAVVTVILLCMMPLAGYIPMPTLAAILILVAYNMSNWREFVNMAKHAPKSDFTVLIVTFLCGVIFDLLTAVEVGVFLSAILFLHRMTNVTSIRRWTNLKDDVLYPGQTQEYKAIPKHTLVYEIEGPIFFATVDNLIEQIIWKETTRVVIVRMRSVSTLDITAIRALENLLAHCQKKQVTLVFSHVQSQPYQVMKKSGFVDKVGAENFCLHIDAALEHAEAIVVEEKRRRMAAAEQKKPAAQ